MKTSNKLTIGQKITCGRGDDRESGIVGAIDGDNVTVQWESGHVTTQSIVALDCDRSGRKKTETITIYRNNIWAGCGRLVDGMIVDCDAILGPDQDASDETYEAIEDEITSEPQDADRYTGTGSVEREDGVYSWTIDVE